MRSLFPIFALLAIGCAGSTPPPTTRYLLPIAPAEGTVRQETPIVIGLRRIDIAPYLREQGLVVETQSGQVRPARFHVWAEPLGAGLRTFLEVEVAAALGRELGGDAADPAAWDYRVDVAVDRLHGTLDGEARIVARWRVRPQGAIEGTAFRLTSSTPLSAEGYAGLVDAEVELMRQLARAIADSLRELPAP